MLPLQRARVPSGAALIRRWRGHPVGGGWRSVPAERVPSPPEGDGQRLAGYT